MEEVHPRVVAAVRAQLEHWRAALDAGARRVGWKIGAGFPEIEAVIGGQPVIGHLTSATLLRRGGAFDARGAHELRAETEAAIAVGPDATIAGLGVALELVDVARPPADLEGIVQANVAHRAVAFGPIRKVMDPRGLSASCVVNGELRERALVEADPAATLEAVAHLLAAVGERLEAGDRIIAGSLTHVPVSAGDRVSAEIEGLGRAEARIAPAHAAAGA